jgi:hypothetical protein
MCGSSSYLFQHFSFNDRPGAQPWKKPEKQLERRQTIEAE